MPNFNRLGRGKQLDVDPSNPNVDLDRKPPGQVIVCYAARDVPPPSSKSGYIPVRCQVCGESLWASPSAQIAIGRYNILPICQRCYLGDEPS